MPTTCPSCGYSNPDYLLYCEQCQATLAEPQGVINRLNAKLETLSARQNEEIRMLREQLVALQQQLAHPPAEGANPQAEAPAPPEPAPVMEEAPIVISQLAAERTPQARPAPRPRRPRKTLREGMPRLPLPLVDGLEVIQQAYAKYKREGKLPIFFMTLAGGLALLFGIGYLMQYSFQFTGEYAEVIKVGLGFVAAFTALVLGIRLSGRDHRYREYGSMVISLGIVLNYVMIYFLSDLGNFPTLSSGLVGFGFIVGNTLLGIGLALRYEARLIAVLFLLGGAFAPFYLQSTEDGTSYYLYLWLLTVGACYVSFRIRWKGLYQLAFGVSSLLLEAAVFLQGPETWQFIVYYHLFAYLFFYILLVQGRGTWRTKFGTPELLLLTANLSFWVVNLYTVTDAVLPELGWLYAGNALVFLLLFAIAPGARTTPGRGLLLLIGGVLLGAAVPCFFEHAYMGLFWALEALLLVFVGQRFRLLAVRREGYFLLALASAKLLWNSYEIVTEWGQSVWHTGLLNLAILGLAFTLAWAWSLRKQDSLQRWEVALLSALGEAVPIILSCLLFVVGWHTLGNWVYPASLGLLVLLVGWTRIFGTRLTAAFGLAAGLLLCYLGWYFAFRETFSLRLWSYPAYGHLALTSLLAGLLGAQWLFGRWNLQSNFAYPATPQLRRIFFLLVPLLVPFYFPPTFPYGPVVQSFAGVLVAYGLYRVRPYRSLRILLFTLAVLSGILLLRDFGNPSNHLATLLALLVLVVAERAWKAESLAASAFRPLLLAAPYLMALTAGQLVVYGVAGDQAFDYAEPALGFWISLLLLQGAAYGQQRLALVQQQRKVLVSAIGWVTLATALWSCIWAGLISETALFLPSVGGALALMFLRTGTFVRASTWYATAKAYDWAMILYQLTWVPVYVMPLQLLDRATGPISSILLVVQAVALIFIALRRHSKSLNSTAVAFFGFGLLKVVFWDTRNFETVEKIIALIAIGLLLLLGAFLFVRLRKRLEERAQSVDTE